MKLKTKIIIVIFISCLATLATLYTAAASIILPSYQDIENQQTRNGVDQTLTTINYRLSEFYGKVRDYAAWDDTYVFVQNYDQEYVDDNLEMSFDNLQLNLVVVADNDGNLVYCQSYDLNYSEPIDTSEEAKAFLQTDKALWNFTDNDQMKTGIILIDGQPVLIAISPILKSSLEGPIMGGLLFGRYLDSQEEQRLTEIMGIDFSFSTIDEFKLQNGADQIIGSLNANPQSILIEEKSPEVISGYTLVNDLDGNPSFVLQVEKNREVFQHGLLTMNIFIAASIALSIIITSIILFILERQIIKPLTILAADVKATFSRASNGTKNSAMDTDEVSVLTGMIQDTVNQKLDAMNDVSRMVAHDLRNPLTGIKGAVYSLRRNYGKEMGEKGWDC